MSKKYKLLTGYKKKLSTVIYLPSSKKMSNEAQGRKGKTNEKMPPNVYPRHENKYLLIARNEKHRQKSIKTRTATWNYAEKVLK